jgi:hypothetical protein
VVHIPKILAGGIESRYYGAGVELMDINERIGVEAGWTGHVARCPATPQRTLRRRPEALELRLSHPVLEGSCKSLPTLRFCPEY